MLDYTKKTAPIIGLFLAAGTALIFSIGGVIALTNSGKNIHAASVACSANYISGTAVGAIGITYSGFAQGESVILYNSSAKITLGNTADSTQITQSSVFSLPATIIPGTYSVAIVTRFPITTTNCIGAPIVIAPPVAVCTYSFNPLKVIQSGKVLVTVNGPASDFFMAQYYDPNQSGGTGTVPNFSRTGPGTIAMSAPYNLGSYQILVTDKTNQVLCSSQTPGTLTVVTQVCKADVNSDGTVTALDAQLVWSKFTTGSKDLTYDINGDGNVSAVDAQKDFSFNGQKCVPSSPSPSPSPTPGTTISCTVSPSTVAQGGSISVTGNGFANGGTSSYPLFIIGAYGTPTVTIGTFNGISATAQIPSTVQNGLFRVGIRVGVDTPDSIIYCSPDLSIQSAPF